MCRLHLLAAATTTSAHVGPDSTFVELGCDYAFNCMRTYSTANASTALLAVMFFID